MDTTVATITVDSELESEAGALLEDLGLDLSTAVTIFLKQTVREQAIPFQIRRGEPNPITIRALDEYSEMKSDPKKYPRYSTFAEAMKDTLDA